MRLDDAVERWCTHLTQVRRLSPATVRAYRSDLADLADAVGEDTPLTRVDLEELREWLWRATSRGDSRATLARRAASARGFFSWAREAELIPTDPALRLVTPKRGRTLPAVGTAASLAEVLQHAAERAETGDPVALRDHAVLELLYGAAVRVSELCGLREGDIDLDRRTVRVVGKGDKERVVPFGGAAARAVAAYLAAGGVIAALALSTLKDRSDQHL